MMTDWKALCEELLEFTERLTMHYYHPAELVTRARAALAAEPVGEWPMGDAAVEAAAELIYSQAMKWAATQPIPSDHINIPAWQQGGNSNAQEVARRTARAALAAKPLVKGPTNEEIERRFQVWWYDEGSGMPPGADEDPEAHVHRISQIAWQNGAYVARYGHQPAPPAEGEVAELVAWLKLTGEGKPRLSDEGYARLTRAADLLEQRHSAPVPVSERLPGPEDCDAEHYCWRWNTIGGLWARQPLARSWYEFESHWLPATALPLPQGEVE